jgi:hypothetical protein
LLTRGWQARTLDLQCELRSERHAEFAAAGLSAPTTLPRAARAKVQALRSGILIVIIVRLG